jgi:hypothetical protein
MKVFVNNPPPSLSGVYSEISWNSQSMIIMLRELFRCRPNEVITSVIVDDDGIKVAIDRE